MDFRNARARQPEILRSVQKDSIYASKLTADVSDLLRLTGSRNWIRYNQICRLLAEISYHGFASLHNMQTLGEEYTGIIQVDSKYQNIPARMLQLSAIILEFGGETIFYYVLQKLEKYIAQHEEIVPTSKTKLIAIIAVMRNSTSYIKALHKSLFYLGSDKYQISKRATGINYVLIRHWLQPEFSLYGYKILGIITFLQVMLSVIISSVELRRETDRKFQSRKIPTKEDKEQEQTSSDQNTDTTIPKCVLCLEPRLHTTLTPCGHLFCWHCIMEWLDEREECPLCREAVKKSNVIQLQNFL